MENDTVIKKNGIKYPLKEDYNRFFYPSDFKKMFELLKTKQQHTAICLINTGARINEIRNVKVEDVTFPNKKIFDDKGTITFRVTKTKSAKGERRGKVRGPLPISSKFAKYLKREIAKRKLGQEDTLGILSTNAFNQALKKASKKAGIRSPNEFSAHNLRKTFETWLMALGLDGFKLMVHLGHDMKTAAAHYVSPDIFNSQQRMEMRDVIGDIYEK